MYCVLRTHFDSEGCKCWMARSTGEVFVSARHRRFRLITKNGHIHGYGFEPWHWIITSFTEAPRFVQQRQRLLEIQRPKTLTFATQLRHWWRSVTRNDEVHQATFVYATTTATLIRHTKYQTFVNYDTPMVIRHSNTEVRQVLTCRSEAPTFARATTKTLMYVRWPDGAEMFVTTNEKEIRSRRPMVIRRQRLLMDLLVMQAPTTNEGAPTNTIPAGGWRRGLRRRAC